MNLEEFESEPPKRRTVRYILSKYVKRKKKTYSLEEVIAELKADRSDGGIKIELICIRDVNYPREAPQALRDLATRVLERIMRK